MRTHSLLFRLGSAAAILIALALALAGFGLWLIFNQEIERRATNELDQIVKFVAAQVRIEADGLPVVDGAPADQRFETPYGGLYWQVSTRDGQRARSRSLWDTTLPDPKDMPDGRRHVTDLQGPTGAPLLAVVQAITVAAPDGKDVPLQVVAAIDRADLAAARHTFLRLLALSLIALGLLLMGAMAIFLRLALRPFDHLGHGLKAIRAGESHALAGTFPDEVQPVVDDLNRLIQFQRTAVERARRQAGDLAHGLKTPLTVLGALARQASEDGRDDIAQSIDGEVHQMRRQVDRVLARARANAGPTLGGKTVAVKPVAAKVVRAFERLAEDKMLRWVVNVAPDARFPGAEDELTEILGNLLDNACKWARSEIRLTANVSEEVLDLCVDDDGSGLSAEQASQIGRGQRWDETQPGTGLGLAITRDLAEARRGSLALVRSDLGGARAHVRIPLDPIA
ncbi:sensor histidine kinase [Afipia carboxidovorans OM5]|uniref:histidine kinase n=1 Tax=Afipia carboxidovorans (strain ATCC 49405 / DSM 1227 / KCTC 32145 / OM5) TaxID=504832 RepID=B6JAM4_AFIC5|nr:HAMP domain-containing sensor histidine kinase [Afipia carboxidovorans]ACI91393.1 sensor histidine kinase [Afipia carboxidovorans OM5]AEI01427.1 signal transduction histidine kinase [Afipia carboxidovorans OM4]AEI05002.1 signal transduction histidine kinase [Afipia carboxidovorans OM5]